MVHLVLALLEELVVLDPPSRRYNIWLNLILSHLAMIDLSANVS